MEWGFCLRSVLEAESCGKMVEGGVDLAVGGVDGVEVTRWRVGVRLLDEAGEWTEQTRAQLDQQDAEFQPNRR